MPWLPSSWHQLFCHYWPRERLFILSILWPSEIRKQSGPFFQTIWTEQFGSESFSTQGEIRIRGNNPETPVSQAGQGQENRNGERMVLQVENGHQDFIRKQENLLWQAEEDTGSTWSFPHSFPECHASSVRWLLETHGFEHLAPIRWYFGRLWSSWSWSADNRLRTKCRLWGSMGWLFLAVLISAS